MQPTIHWSCPLFRRMGSRDTTHWKEFLFVDRNEHCWAVGFHCCWDTLGWWIQKGRGVEGDRRQLLPKQRTCCGWSCKLEAWNLWHSHLDSMQCLWKRDWEMTKWWHCSRLTSWMHPACSLSQQMLENLWERISTVGLGWNGLIYWTNPTPPWLYEILLNVSNL